jgi:hypothetical protein
MTKQIIIIDSDVLVKFFVNQFNDGEHPAAPQ